jgi:cobalt-zinc-cadmium efflux system membrane fusion protein
MNGRNLTGALSLVLLLASCTRPGDVVQSAGQHASGDHGDEDEMEKGVHRGRLLRDGAYAVELGIAEDGTPPRFQAWIREDGKPVAANAASIEVQLTRLGGVNERHVLTAQSDGSFLATRIVGEPHSFDVEVIARVGESRLHWSYPSYEGRTGILAEIAAEAGIRVEPVGPGTIADAHEVQGLLTPIESRVARVMARFPGPIRSVHAQVGDRVRAGQALAVIESNLSLSNYTVAAPIPGSILARQAVLGALAGEGAELFEIADLSELWVDLHIFGADTQHIRAGVPVTVTRMSDGVTADTVLERVLPGTATASQSTVARATLVNSDSLWRPGSAVKARITVALQPGALVVPLTAVQAFRDRDVVFVRVGDLYEVRRVELGNRDAVRVEILSGINAGDLVVVEQSYLVKADIEKSGAFHDH